MKIKDSLPQFNENRALVVVTGQEHAIFYLASQGEINVIDKTKKKEERSERADKLDTRTSGSVVSGSDEEKTRAEVRLFLKDFANMVPKILKKTKADSLYLFSPAYMGNEILTHLPKQNRLHLHGHFDGNYSHKHPFDLLEMIQKSAHGSHVEPKSKEAQMLYDKFSKDK
jgi:dsDNA-binding SOS-regulon protein